MCNFYNNINVIDNILDKERKAIYIYNLFNKDTIKKIIYNIRNIYINIFSNKEQGEEHHKCGYYKKINNNEPEKKYMIIIMKIELLFYLSKKGKKI